MVKNTIGLLLLILLITLRIVSKKRRQLEYKLIEENSMGLIYGINLTNPKSTDVIRRVLKVNVDGVETLKDLPISAKPKQHLLDPVREGATVVVSVQDIDDSGNASDWWSVSFVAKDTIPPETPEGMTVSLVQEVADAVPEVVDTPPEVVDTPPEVVDAPPVVVEGEAVVTPPED